MKTHDRKDSGQRAKEQKPYPYNVTHNPVLVKKLLEGYKIDKTALRMNEHGVLVADVTLVKDETVEVLKGIFGKDTPAGRAAIRQAEEAPREKVYGKKVRVGKTAKKNGGRSTASVKADQKAKAKANSAKANNHQASGAVKDQDGSAKKAGLGKGQTKK
ncbi:MAG: hypothetical protein WC878_06540 [Candidatus Paceibacterota bacterium]